LTLGGFGAAFSRDITPLCRAVRASSPTGTVHAFACNSYHHGRQSWGTRMEYPSVPHSCLPSLYPINAE
ncbi:hypothetical protein T029_25305, partial [Salmonella enterica subsp. enterica serovar Give]|nr:hypothetical protein [Salmonella enterica subsp. enterica serovar Give]